MKAINIIISINVGHSRELLPILFHLFISFITETSYKCNIYLACIYGYNKYFMVNNERHWVYSSLIQIVVPIFVPELKVLAWMFACIRKMSSIKIAKLVILRVLHKYSGQSIWLWIKLKDIHSTRAVVNWFGFKVAKYIRKNKLNNVVYIKNVHFCVTNLNNLSCQGPATH